MADPVLLTVAEFEELAGRDRVADLAGRSPTDQRRAVEAAILRASGEAVSALLPRYGEETPRTAAAAPRHLQEQVATSALYHLAVMGSSQVPEELIRQHAEVVDWYNQLACYRRSLDLHSTTAGVDPRPAHISTCRPAARFGDGKLEEMLP